MPRSPLRLCDLHFHVPRRRYLSQTFFLSSPIVKQSNSDSETSRARQNAVIHYASRPCHSPCFTRWIISEASRTRHELTMVQAGPPKQADVVAQSQILEFEGSARAKERT